MAPKGENAAIKAPEVVPFGKLPIPILIKHGHGEILEKEIGNKEYDPLT
jgi:hypothetical protein